jgi:hypothetical protein
MINKTKVLPIIAKKYLEEMRTKNLLNNFTVFFNLNKILI